MAADKTNGQQMTSQQALQMTLSSQQGLDNTMMIALKSRPELTLISEWTAVSYKERVPVHIAMIKGYPYIASSKLKPSAKLAIESKPFFVAWPYQEIRTLKAKEANYFEIKSNKASNIGKEQLKSSLTNNGNIITFSPWIAADFLGKKYQDSVKAEGRTLYAYQIKKGVNINISSKAMYETGLNKPANSSVNVPNTNFVTAKGSNGMNGDYLIAWSLSGNSQIIDFSTLDIVSADMFSEIFDMRAFAGRSVATKDGAYVAPTPIEDFSLLAGMIINRYTPTLETVCKKFAEHFGLNYVPEKVGDIDLATKLEVPLPGNTFNSLNGRVFTLTFESNDKSKRIVVILEETMKDVFMFATQRKARHIIYYANLNVNGSLPVIKNEQRPLSDPNCYQNIQFPKPVNR